MLSRFLSNLSEKVASQSDLWQAALLIQAVSSFVIFLLVIPIAAIAIALSFGIVYFSGNE